MPSRITFEFERTDDVQNFLEKVDHNFASGTLIIGGKWHWMAERFETIAIDQLEKRNDDD